MRVLVTGGAGFIGSHCVDFLCEQGHEVRVLDNYSTGLRSNLDQIRHDVELLDGDICDDGAIGRACQGMDVVIHLAALGSVPRSISNPLGTNEANLTGTLKVLLAARDAGIQRVVFSSSSSTYGSNTESPKQEWMAGDPISPYALSKLAGEHYCRLFYELYGLETVRVRFFNVFGPRQTADHVYAAVIPRFIASALGRRKLEIHGDGLQSRDFTYVDNVVEGLERAVLASSAAVAGEAFNMAAGASTAVLDVARAIAALMDHEVVWEHVEPRPGDIRNSLADNSKAAEAFGYNPKVTVGEGIRKTVAAHRVLERLTGTRS